MPGIEAARQRALRDLPKRRIRKRIVIINRWLADNAPECKTKQGHLDEDTPERAYWHHGYVAALRDVMNLLNSQAPQTGQV